MSAPLPIFPQWEMSNVFFLKATCADICLGSGVKVLFPLTGQHVFSFWKYKEV